MNHAYVLGYHGCEREFGERLIAKQEKFAPSSGVYHWLGTGVYFWENDPVRAKEWAEQKQARGACKEPFVVGAVIELRRCLDLQTREHLQLLKDTFDAFHEEKTRLGLKVPENKPAKHDSRDVKVLRYLDHAVIETLHKIAEEAGLTPFDTVRSAFSEGESIFPGSGILELTHSQIAVRNIDCIKGVFAA